MRIGGKLGGEFGAGAQSGQFGTFNAAAAAMAGSTGQLTVEKQQLDKMEDIDDKLGELVKAAKDGGLVFG